MIHGNILEVITEFITEEQFLECQKNFINFPDYMHTYIKAYKNERIEVNLQTKLKYKIFNKTAYLYLIKNNLCILFTKQDELYWLYTDGEAYYLNYIKTNGGAGVEYFSFVRCSDIKAIHLLEQNHIIYYNRDRDFVQWKTAHLREKQINEILN